MRLRNFSSSTRTRSTPTIPGGWRRWLPKPGNRLSAIAMRRRPGGRRRFSLSAYLPRTACTTAAGRGPWRSHVGGEARSAASLLAMPWPIDDQRDQDPVVHLVGPDLRPRVRERLWLERSIAKRHGLGCFADYFADRRAQGWGLNRLAHE